MSARLEVRAPLVSLAFARGYGVTMRPYLLFISGIAGISGIALAPAAPIGAAVALAAACFLAYGFGQALTDCFQTDTDELSSPYRPLVQGKIARGHVLGVSVAGLALSGAVMAWLRPTNLALAALAAIGLLTYTPFKRRWWAGPFYNAWIVAVLTLIAWRGAAGAAQTPAAWDATLVGTLVAVFFGYAVFVLAGYFKDVAADRATGYRTLPVVFGLGPAAWVCDAFAALQLLGAAVAGAALVQRDGWTAARLPGLAMMAAGGLLAVLAEQRLHQVRRDADAHRAIVPGLHAYVLLLAGLAALARPAWAAPLALYCVAFALALHRRPVREQI